MKRSDPRELEKEFHDRKAADSPQIDHYAWGILDRADRYAYDLLGDLRDKVILDLGCGEGHHAARFAQGGAIVYAIDLSTGMVEKARGTVKEKGLDDRVRVLQMNAEELQPTFRTAHIWWYNKIESPYVTACRTSLLYLYFLASPKYGG